MKGSRFMLRGGGGVTEQQTGEETGSLLGSVWAPLNGEAAPNQIEDRADFPSAWAVLCFPLV